MKRNTRTHQAPTLILAAAATLAVLSAPANAQFAGFQRTDFPSPVAQPVHMALGDLDSDGDLDVAITTDFNVRIISNNGDGTLGETSFTSTSIGGGYIIIDDFDGINGLDMCIVARLTLGKFTILLNDGSGSFMELPSVSLGVAPFDGISGDFDFDGDIDLAIVSENLGEFTVAINDGAGGFTPLSPVTVDTSHLEDIAAADLDGDGDLDIAVMDRINNRLWLYTNDGSGGFADAGISYPFSSGNRHTLTSVDINQDGLVDFLLSSGNVVSMLNAGDGSLVPQTPFLGLGLWAMSIFAPDLDGDGNLDVVVSDVNSTVFRYAFGIGDGTFAEATSNGTSNFVSWVATGDMDGNGTPDVVVHTRNPGFIEVFINQTDIDGDGDGLNDDDEAAFGTDPNNPDTDGDGLLDGAEVEMAQGSGCPDPLNPDSDGDTLSDGAEVAAGTNPCNVDTDGDTLTDDVDPHPLDPEVSSGDLEDATRFLCLMIQTLDLSLFNGPNDNANAGRRNALANRCANAANAIAINDIDDAIDELASLLAKIDGESPPPDWMDSSNEKTALANDVIVLIALLLVL